jgi:hypothetical protein
MQKDQTFDQIEKEAHLLSALSKLLKKKRSPEKTHAVEAVMNDYKNTALRIEKIKEIDNKINSSSRTCKDGVEESKDGREKFYTKSSSGGNQSRENGPLTKQEQALSKTESPYRDRIELVKKKSRRERRKSFKKVMHRSGLFKFLFIEWPHIKSFGEKTMTLKMSIFPPAFQLNHNVSQSLINNQQKAAKVLIERLEMVEKKGWLYLTKKSYNLLMVLKDLCVELILTSFHFRKGGDATVIDRYRIMENLVYFFLVRQEPVKELLDCIETAETSLPQLKSKVQDGDPSEHLIKWIIGKEFVIPSLFQFLLAGNMLKYRSYVTEQELLILDEREKQVETDVFNCPSDVNREIQKHLEQLKASIEEDVKRIQEMRRIKVFIKNNDSDENISFLQSLGGSGENNGFKGKGVSVLREVPAWFGGYAALFQQGFCEYINIKGEGNVKIFPVHQFLFEFDTLETQKKRIHKLGEKIHNMKWERFFSLRQSMKNAMSVEHDIIHAVDRGIKTVREIMFKTIDLLKLPEVQEKNLLRGEEVEVSLDAVVHSNIDLLNEKTLKQYMESGIQFAYAILSELKDAETFSIINEEERISRELEKKMSNLERIGSKEEYQEIRQRLVTLYLLESN